MADKESSFRRFECKYVISEAETDAIRCAIRPYVEPDPHACRRDCSYEIRSLYLDAPDLRLFWETQEGQLRRLKLRVRDYPAAPRNEPIYLEIKRRYDRLVLKDRTAMDRQGIAALLAGEAIDPTVFTPPEQACFDEFQGWISRWQARPIVWISYRREAYAGLYHPGLRITFDRQLRCAPAEFLREPADDDWRSLEPWGVVLELKFDTTYPRWLQRLVERFELKQQSYSKYGHAIRRGVSAWHLPPGCAFGLPRG